MLKTCTVRKIRLVRFTWLPVGGIKTAVAAVTPDILAVRPEGEHRKLVCKTLVCKSVIVQNLVDLNV